MYYRCIGVNLGGFYFMENTNTFDLEKAISKRNKVASAFVCLQLVGVFGLASYASSLGLSLDGSTFFGLVINWIFIGCICSGRRWAAVTMLVFWVIGFLQAFQMFDYLGYDSSADMLIGFSFIVAILEGALLIYLVANAEIGYSFDEAKRERLESKLSEMNQNQ
jgi:hypothetical protein